MEDMSEMDRPVEPVLEAAPAPELVGAAAAPVQSQAPVQEIQTLPPLPEVDQSLPLSPATGQPRRHPVMLLGAGLLYASSVVTAAGLGLFWWLAINITHFHDSARLLTWTKPTPGFMPSMIWVTVVALIGIAVTAAPAVAAFQAWNGWEWSRKAALVAVAVTLLSILLHPWAAAAIALAVLGTGVLWTPPVKRYFDQWARFRAADERHPQYFDTVRYGPLDRYRATEAPQVTVADR